MITDLNGAMERLVTGCWDSGLTYNEAVREFKRRFIRKALAATCGNQVKAAAKLGMHRNTLDRTIKDLKIDFRHNPRGTQRRQVDLETDITAIGATA